MRNEIEITSEDVNRWLYKVGSVISNYSKKVLYFLNNIENYIPFTGILPKCNECNKTVYSNIQYNGKRVCMRCMQQMLNTAPDNYNIQIKNGVTIETGTRIHTKLEELRKATINMSQALSKTNTNTPMPKVKPPRSLSVKQTIKEAKTTNEKLFRLSKEIDKLADEWETPVGVHNKLHGVATTLREII